MTITINAASGNVCPKCNRDTIERIRRSSLFKLLFFWLPVKKYQCRYCSFKFFKWSGVVKNQ